MNTIAAIRPSEWDLPLFLHILGGMALVGALVLAMTYLAPAWRGGALAPLSAGFRTLLYAALPSYLVTRLSAQWIADEQGLLDDDVETPAWIDIGFITTDVGLLFLLIATIGSGFAVRRARRAGGEPGGGAARLATVLVALLIVAYLVAIWAMTTKPT